MCCNCKYGGVNGWWPYPFGEGQHIGPINIGTANQQLTNQQLDSFRQSLLGAAQDPRFYSKERKAKDYAADVRKRKGWETIKRGDK